MTMQRRVLLITVGQHVAGMRDALAHCFTASNPAGAPRDEVRLRAASLHVAAMQAPTVEPAPFACEICPIPLTPGDIHALYHDARVRRWSSVNWIGWRDRLPSTRLMAKLALFHHYDTVRAAITRAINRLGSDEMPLHIYIAAPLHDSFASIVIDLAVMAHRAARDNDRVFGVLLLPDMQGDPVPGAAEAHQAHAYAALRELHFYESLPSFYSDHQKYAGDIDASRYRLFDDDLRDTSPFLRGDVYLIGGAVRESGELLAYTDAITAAAELIYWQTASPLADRIAVSPHGTGSVSAFGIGRARIRALDDALERRRRIAYLLRWSQRGGDGTIDTLPARRIIDDRTFDEGDQGAVRDARDTVRAARQRCEELIESITLDERVLRAAGGSDARDSFADAARASRDALRRYGSALLDAVTAASAEVRDSRLSEALRDVLAQPSMNLERAAESHREIMRLTDDAVDRAASDARTWADATHAADDASARDYARLLYAMQPTSGAVALLLIALLGVSGAGLLISLSDTLVPLIAMLLVGLGVIYHFGVVDSRRAARSGALAAAVESYLSAIDTHRQHLEAIAYQRYIGQAHAALVARLYMPDPAGVPMPGKTPDEARLRARAVSRRVSALVAAEGAAPPRDMSIPDDLSQTLGVALLHIVTDAAPSLLGDPAALDAHVRELVQRDGLSAADRTARYTLPAPLIREKIAQHAPLTLLALDTNRLPSNVREVRPPLVAALGWDAPETEEGLNIEPLTVEEGIEDDMILIRYRTGIPVRALLHIEDWKSAYIRRCEYLSPTNTRLFSRAFLHPTRVGTASMDPLSAMQTEREIVPYLTMAYALFMRWYASRALLESVCRYIGVAFTNDMNWDEFCGAVGDNPVPVRDALREGARLLPAGEIDEALDRLRQAVRTRRPNASETNADWELWTASLLMDDLNADARGARRLADTRLLLTQLFTACAPPVAAPKEG